MAYVVKAGYVSAETKVGPGRAVIDIPRGAELPGDVPDEQVQQFLRLDQIESVDSPVAGDGENEDDEVDLSELDKDQLLALAEEREIQVDKRWGPDKLIAALQGE
jgi:hypothetical protein